VQLKKTWNLKTYDRAIGYLARREHSAKELTAKLTAKGHPLPEIHEAMTRLQAENLQSESRFVESFVRSRISQGKGPRVITQSLEEHGIPADQIKIALESAEVCWFTLAIQVRHQRFGQEIPADFPEKAKQMRFLQYRGFEMEQIRGAFIKNI
jgi:regulatory protein